MRKGRVRIAQENERDLQRKMYEENLRKKKELLMQEFEKSEAVAKFSALSVASHNDVKFKNEYANVIYMRTARQEQLE